MKTGSMLEGDPASEPVRADDMTVRTPIPALTEALGVRGVRYCHWKSNVRLAESLAGDGDLDILVRRSDAEPFFAALIDSGFKLAEGTTGSWSSGRAPCLRARSGAPAARTCSCVFPGGDRRQHCKMLSSALRGSAARRRTARLRRAAAPGRSGTDGLSSSRRA